MNRTGSLRRGGLAAVVGAAGGLLLTELDHQSRHAPSHADGFDGIVRFWEHLLIGVAIVLALDLVFCAYLRCALWPVAGATAAVVTSVLVVVGFGADGGVIPDHIGPGGLYVLCVALPLVVAALSWPARPLAEA